MLVSVGSYNPDCLKEERMDKLHSGQHGRRTAEQHLASLVVQRLAEPLLDLLLGDEANTVSPSLRRVVEDVVYGESTSRLNGERNSKVLVEERRTCRNKLTVRTSSSSSFLSTGRVRQT